MDVEVIYLFLVSTLLRGRVLSSFFSASVCLSSLYLLAGFCGVGGMLTFIATATTQNVLLHFHTCYAAARSLALPHIRRATLLHCTSTHTSCYAAARSLALPHIRHATLLHVLFHFHTYVLLRCCTFSCTSTRASCYAAACSLALPHIRHATLLHCTCTHTSCYAAALHFHIYVMLRCCTALHTYVLLRCCTALAHIRHATLRH